MEINKLDEIKNNFTTYNYPWVNLINGKYFSSRNLLLIDLKKHLSLNEYKYVYDKKYVYITNYILEDILNMMNVDPINKHIKSPVDDKWYDYNKIFNHLSCFFDEENRRFIVYEMFKKYDLIPSCIFSNQVLTINDFRISKNAKTPHPDNSLFNKYIYSLSIDDYNSIHTSILKSPKVIEKKISNWTEMKNDPLRNASWRENMSIAHQNIEHLWLTNPTEEEKLHRRKKSSESQKKNILNGTFTPQNNYRTKRRINMLFNGKEYYFRSSWEVCFFISNPELEYESIRIKYVTKNQEKIYIPDFIDPENKILYELKPKRQYIAQIDKMDGAIKWCLENGYKFIWVNEYNLIDFINKDKCMVGDFLVYYNKMIKGLKL